MKTDIPEFITAARACVHQLLENAVYVRRELPNVDLPDPLRREVEALCDTWLEAKHDAFTGLIELAEAADTDGSDATDLANRCRQIDGILVGVFAPTDHVVQRLQEAAAENPALGLAAILVTESARNIIITYPAFRVTKECSAGKLEGDDSTEDLDDDESGEDYYGFQSEDFYPVRQLIDAVRSLLNRSELSAETLEQLRVFLSAMERLPQVTAGIRMGLTLRLDHGGESDWVEIRMEDGEFTLSRGTWTQGEAHTETVFEVGQGYRDGDAFAACGFADSFARCAEDVCREVVIDDTSYVPAQWPRPQRGQGRPPRRLPLAWRGAHQTQLLPHPRMKPEIQKFIAAADTRNQQHREKAARVPNKPPNPDLPDRAEPRTRLPAAAIAESMYPICELATGPRIDLTLVVSTLDPRFYIEVAVEEDRFLSDEGFSMRDYVPVTAADFPGLRRDTPRATLRRLQEISSGRACIVTTWGDAYWTTAVSYPLI